ncbi:MAG TPA: exodeoxyribonuclease VII large subunit, partial [Bacteroidota bacterium]
RDLVDILDNIRYTMRQRLQDRIEESREHLNRLLLSYSFNRPKDLVLQYSQRVDELEKSLSLAVAHRFESAQKRQISLHQQLEALSPRNVLGRGYVIVRKGNQVVTKAGSLSDGDRTDLQFQDGNLGALIEKIEKK